MSPTLFSVILGSWKITMRRNALVPLTSWPQQFILSNKNFELNIDNYGNAFIPINPCQSLWLRLIRMETQTRARGFTTIGERMIGTPTAVSWGKKWSRKCVWRKMEKIKLPSPPSLGSWHGDMQRFRHHRWEKGCRRRREKGRNKRFGDRACLCRGASCCCSYGFSHPQEEERCQTKRGFCQGWGEPDVRRLLQRREGERTNDGDLEPELSLRDQSGVGGRGNCQRQQPLLWHYSINENKSGFSSVNMRQ